jgi:hypothetical protein
MAVTDLANSQIAVSVQHQFFVTARAPWRHRYRFGRSCFRLVSNISSRSSASAINSLKPASMRGVLGEAPNRAQTNEPAAQPSFFVFPIHRRPIGTAVPTIGPPSHGTISAGQPYGARLRALSPARQTRSDRGANCGAFSSAGTAATPKRREGYPRMVYPARGQPVRSPLSG